MINETKQTEQGFTLIELLMAMMLSGILLLATTTAFITTARGMVDLHDRFVQSHDAQLLAAYFPSDVQSADPNLPPTATFGVDQSPTAWAVCTGTPPSGTTNVLQLQWSESAPALTAPFAVVTTPFAVSYRTYKSGSDWQLIRYFCSGAVMKPDVVAHNLAEQIGPTAKVPQVGLPVPPDSQKLTLTLFSDPARAGAYSYTFSGRMRTPVPPPPYPRVSYIVRKTPPTSPTSATTVSWTVVFDRPVTGVDSSDFLIVAPGFSGLGTPTVTPVSPGQTDYTVTISFVTGSGALGLSLLDNDSIFDTTLPPHALGGPVQGDGDFPYGQSYEIDQTPPTVVSIDRAVVNPTSGPNVSWTVTFSERVTGVNAGDFAPAASGVTGGDAISVAAVSATVYTVTAGPVVGPGTLGLNLVDNNSVEDDAFNVLVGPASPNGSFTGQVYTINAAAPAAPSITDVQLLNKSGNPSTAGKIEKGDSVVIKFSAIMDVSTLCSTPGSSPWTGDGNDQSKTANDDVTVNVANNGSNDTLTVTSATCTVHFESINLAGNYVNNPVAFGGSGGNASSITWTTSTHTLIVTLGAGSGANSDYNTVSSSQPVYTAWLGTTNPTGQPVDNSPYTFPASGQQF